MHDNWDRLQHETGSASCRRTVALAHWRDAGYVPRVGEELAPFLRFELEPRYAELPARMAASLAEFTAGANGITAGDRRHQLVPLWLVVCYRAAEVLRHVGNPRRAFVDVAYAHLRSDPDGQAAVVTAWSLLGGRNEAERLPERVTREAARAVAKLAIPEKPPKKVKRMLRSKGIR